ASARYPAPSSVQWSCSRCARGWSCCSSTLRRKTSSWESSWWRRSDSILSYAGDRGEQDMAVSQQSAAPAPAPQRVPLVEMRNIRVSFGGVRAVEGDGTGKTTLMRTLSGARPPDAGQIFVNGNPVTIANPRDAKALGIETIYQTLALADNLDAPANCFLGRELMGGGSLNDSAMES